MKKRDPGMILFSMFLFLGIVITLQFRSVLIKNEQISEEKLTTEKLKQQIIAEQARGEALKNEITNLERQKKWHIEESEVINEDLKAELEGIKLIAGLTAVKGPGVTIKMNDAPHVKNINPNLLIIHDRDIVEVLNELKKAGAQAISVNGQRIISTSEQVCTGPTVRINKSRYAVPYIIKAIGEPEKLVKELENSSIVSILRTFNIKVEIVKEKEIIIPAYNHSIDNLITGLEVVNE